MNIKPIHTKRGYKAALKAVEGLINARAGSLEGGRLDILRSLGVRANRLSISRRSSPKTPWLWPLVLVVQSLFTENNVALTPGVVRHTPKRSKHHIQAGH